MHQDWPQKLLVILRPSMVTGEIARPFFLSLPASRSARRRRAATGRRDSIESEAHSASCIAAARSSFTSFNNSSSFISVKTFRRGTEEVSGELSLGLDHLVDLLLDRAAANELVHQHIFGLSDTECAVRGLVFNSRIPPAVEVNHVRRGGQVQSGAAGLERQHEERHVVVLLEPTDQILALADRGLAVQHEPGAAEHEPRNAASGAVVSRNWVKTSAFSCLAAITSAISRRRANLPLSSSAQAPSPSHCEG